jgi:hypothetical protein
MIVVAVIQSCAYMRPLAVIDFPASPECGGTQWSVTDEDTLAHLTALTLVGRARQAVRVLQGAQPGAALAVPQLKAALRAKLFVQGEQAIWHRDGLLFEIIAWLVAEMTAQPNEVVSEPHSSSTQQGLDTIKVRFDPVVREIVRAVIYEQKCTDNARQLFLRKVLPEFKRWLAGVRDGELLQIAIGLMQRFDLTDAEYQRAYDRLAQDRPLGFQASLTVTPTPFATAQCVALFKGYAPLTPNIADRLGDTLPLQAIRPWFDAFAKKVWASIEAANV